MNSPHPPPAEPPVFTQFYDLLQWAFARAEAFPKALRPTLTQRFLTALLDVLDGLLELRFDRQRGPRFNRVNLDIDRLRILSRALKDRRALSLPQYEFFNRELDAVGRQLGGWMKATTHSRPKPAPRPATGL